LDEAYDREGDLGRIKRRVSQRNEHDSAQRHEKTKERGVGDNHMAYKWRDSHNDSLRRPRPGGKERQQPGSARLGSARIPERWPTRAIWHRTGGCVIARAEFAVSCTHLW
jgi:hypothetical protein